MRGPLPLMRALLSCEVAVFDRQLGDRDLREHRDGGQGRREENDIQVRCCVYHSDLQSQLTPLADQDFQQVVKQSQERDPHRRLHSILCRYGCEGLPQCIHATDGHTRLLPQGIPLVSRLKSLKLTCDLVILTQASMLFTKNMKRLSDPRGEGEDGGQNRNIMSMF